MKQPLNVNNSLFCEFDASVDISVLPNAFTYPYYYKPHTLANHAAKQLQAKLERLAQELGENAVNKPGRMFGVLVVKTALGRIGYLSAFSGQSKMDLGDFFVPEIIDPAIHNSLQQAIEPQLNDLTQRIELIKSSERIEVLEQELNQVKRESDKAIAELKQLHAQRRRERKAKRLLISQHTNASDYQQRLITLSQQSISDKRALTKAKDDWKRKSQFLQNALTDEKDHLLELQQQYQQLIDQFQQQLFEQCPLRNAEDGTKSLSSLFEMLGQTVPEGAGEGAFIKLLQYAYLNDYQPLTMAQFWWGKSPKAESRQHGQFYGACRRKCKPLLSHMVKGLDLEPNLLDKKACIEESIQIIYQDESMAVINKPPGLLSVPGSDIKDCVQSRMQSLFPNATGPLIVHRLDMSTSGLMVIALNLDSYLSLQRQFIERTVKKRYVALLEGQLRQQQGEIALPLRVDLDDRPRQLVCHDYGKPALTYWQCIEHQQDKTKVYFYPQTGRTHQLRLHAAHAQGLNHPIVGDELYGYSSNRLYLHAEQLEIKHPSTGQRMLFQSDADFC